VAYDFQVKEATASTPEPKSQCEACIGLRQQSFHTNHLYLLCSMCKAAYSMLRNEEEFRVSISSLTFSNHDARRKEKHYATVVSMNKHLYGISFGPC
jgi:hypothetical protein